MFKDTVERPQSHDKELDTLNGYAMCLPNLTRLQTNRIAEHQPILCVEIKPKWRFIPFLSSVTCEMKHKVCRYYMHQHLKVATGKWKQISKYCSLSLFSGNKQRMVQMLDLLDIEGLYPLYNHIERKMFQIDGPYDEGFYQKLFDLSTEDDRTVAFTLMKDASCDQKIVVLSSRSRLAFSVSVLDLDLKPYENIPHQYKLDTKIVSYYSKTEHAKDDTIMWTQFKESEDCTLVLHKV
ncbi:Inositol-pentakisphosphate 2-kinase [Heterocephalus glaber]|uniref:Inositol-pentakisphosphate 2-kinase n=1 Tax=Heterocephalus glaber TaxID=10181 RepID=G5B7G6_HETGA|nr:Inositol-pentakisphosphate 2-kinase [Heterocephalus glaber]